MKSSNSYTQTFLVWSIIVFLFVALSVFSVNFIESKTPSPGSGESSILQQKID
jgi:hypothetical protein